MSFTATKLKEEHKYEFKVYAENEVGLSENAAELPQPVLVAANVEVVKEETVEVIETEQVTEKAIATQEVFIISYFFFLYCKVHDCIIFLYVFCT